MNQKLKEKILESLSAVLPITGIVLLLSILLVPIDLGTMVMFIVGAIMLVIGMGFFQLGAEMSMTPLGEGIGVQISKTRHIPLIFLIGFSMGAIITISEPDLQVLAEQVPSIPNLTLILTVAVGVGIFLAVAIIRILFQINLSTILIVLYTVLIGVSFLVSRDFLAVAFDSGGVTTGPMTVPFIMAMGVGLASVRGDKNASSDSFGLVALSSVGPILAVLAFFGIAALTVGVLLCYIQLNAISRNIVRMKTEITALEVEQVGLLTKYEQSFDLTSVKEAAESYGMVQPSESQIYNIELPGANQAVSHSGRRSAGSAESLLDRVLDKLRGLLE